MEQRYPLGYEPLPARPRRPPRLRGVAVPVSEESNDRGRHDVVGEGSDEIPTTENRVEGETPWEKKYEYLDHTADIQLHSWGKDVREAFEQVVVAMFGYMTELECVECTSTTEIEANGHDMLSLLFAFLDEWLYTFSTTFFVAKECYITEFDRETWRIRARGWVGLIVCKDVPSHPVQMW
eukprot:TRINITY_DN1507_c0_g1_i3.p2 TRINITY_DN1507_c0_g1~~TRINITY_DN1507_c0_g1_i3.p2  ORF type:complete len:180 (+),score=35.60 TRINITY_DN1507_c0_g1_i3:2-541(+)